MYQGLDKGGGGLVGIPDAAYDRNEVVESLDTTSCDEAFYCIDLDESGNERNAVFIANLDVNDGSVCWTKYLDEEKIHSTLRRTIGMSLMTSMLRDKDRNSTYGTAISNMITYFKENHRMSPVVLDIGCGTGLLSMLAAKYGAEKVHAFEMFHYLAIACQEVVTSNQLGDVIDVHCMRSSDFVVDEPLADILVSELLDSALLGEGVLHTHSHAIENLMKIDYNDNNGQPHGMDDLQNRIVPHSAIVYVKLLDCPIVNSMQNVHNFNYFGMNPFRDEEAMRCEGDRRLIPVHWGTLESRGGRVLSDPAVLFDVEFFHNKDDFSDTVQITITVKSSGTIHGLFLYWDLNLLSPELDPSRSVKYSTAPGHQNWQDHWLQVVYPLPKSIVCEEGDKIVVRAAHDGLRIWLDAIPAPLVEGSEGSEQPDPPLKKSKQQSSGEVDGQSPDYQKEESPSSIEMWQPSTCECGWHVLYSSERFEALNDLELRNTWDKAMTQVVADVINRMSQSGTSALENGKFLLLDVCDGSSLAFRLAMILSRLQHLDSSTDVERHREVGAEVIAAEISSGNIDYSSESAKSCLRMMKVVSVEEKQFSRVLHQQVSNANVCLEDLLYIWDGQDWSELESELEEVDEDGEMVEVADGSADLLIGVDNGEKSCDVDRSNRSTNLHDALVPDDASSSAPVYTRSNGSDHYSRDIDGSVEDQTESNRCVENLKVAAIVSDCFWYQLHAQPTWQAIRFLYASRAIRSRSVDEVVICPRRARVMVIAVQLVDLQVSHGDLQTVSGFDHSDFDKAKEGWDNHYFPYKLGCYSKHFLSKPVCIAEVDYINSDVINHTSNQEGFEIPIIRDGRCDCMAIWMDYDLTENQTIRYLKDELDDFPHHLKCFLKFFKCGLHVKRDSAIISNASYVNGDSDITTSYFVKI